MGMVDFNITEAGKAVSGLFTGIRESLTGEKIKDPQAMAEIQYKFAELESRWKEFKSKALELQTSIIIAEAQGESWLQRNWRPVTMLGFLTIIFMYWFGIQPENVSQETITELFGIIKIGLGGYVLGRSGEKIAKTYLETKKV
jgi:hypothetical protein